MTRRDEPNWFELIANDDLSPTFKEWCETVGALQQLIAYSSQHDEKAETQCHACPVDLKRLLALNKELEEKLFS